MADETTPAVRSRTAARPRPVKYKVRKIVPGLDTHPVIHSDESEAVAKRFITTNHPRGRAVYLETPAGDKFHYSADHQTQGEDPWLPYEEEEED